MISLLAAAAALSYKLVSLYDFAFWLPLPPCLPSSFFMISLLAAAAALSVKLVPLQDFAFGCRCRLVFLVSLQALGCRCRLVHLLDFAFGCRCRLVSQACLPS